MFVMRREYRQRAAVARNRPSCLPVRGKLVSRLGCSQAVAAAVRRCWKHSRQNTGLPCVGLKGTVVSLPQPEQLVRVSTFE